MTGSKAKHPALTRTAYHEAGHAVMACILRRRLRSVTIVPSEEAGSLGHAAFHRLGYSFQPDVDASTRTRTMIERELLVNAAGDGAEFILTDKHNVVGATTDRVSAVDLASYIAPSAEECGAYINWLWIRARTMLAIPHHWASIEAVANALLQQKTLSAPKVRRIIFEARYTPEQQAIITSLKEAGKQARRLKGHLEVGEDGLEWWVPDQAEE